MSMWCGPLALGERAFLLIALFQIIYFCGLSAEALQQASSWNSLCMAGSSALSHGIVI
jgi:hypothetical protein